MQAQQVVAQLRNLRVAPRKVRLVADLVRGKKVTAALEILKSLSKRSAHPLAKLLHAAETDARVYLRAHIPQLFIKEMRVDGGPMLKRMRPRARGRGVLIRKRSSHITLVLGVKIPTEGSVDARSSVQVQEKLAIRHREQRENTSHVSPRPKKSISRSLLGRLRAGGGRRTFNRKIIP
ncbi:MAG: large subunit ribosomal protein L22 [Parcubacteria group bacterium Gr01-1014_66]|nr:MAG: large subunit ribosomal protein L22 [Parcubacteria group bacterium Gr01-1014_66]